MPREKSHMDRVLRILILEDCATDADLMEYELHEASIDFVAQRVITEKDYRCALREFAPDIILSDYDLPSTAAHWPLPKQRVDVRISPLFL
mgnify:CR=1 FL=1